MRSYNLSTVEEIEAVNVHAGHYVAVMDGTTFPRPARVTSEGWDVATDMRVLTLGDGSIWRMCRHELVTVAIPAQLSAHNHPDRWGGYCGKCGHHFPADGSERPAIIVSDVFRIDALCTECYASHVWEPAHWHALNATHVVHASVSR